MHYIDEGHGDPVLLVHGNPTWSFYWRKVVAGVMPARRAVAVDHLGCGLSDVPDAFDYRLQSHIDNLVALVQSLDLRRITLVVHDWGGPIGVGAALRCPERFARFVLLNTGLFPPPFIPRRIAVCQTPLVGKLALQGLNLFSRAALRMAVADRRRLDSIARAGLIAPYDSWRNRRAVYGFVRDIPRSARHPTWKTLCQIEQGVRTLSDRPVDLVWGLQDWCFDARCLQRLQASLPGARVNALEGIGHWVAEEAPEVVIAAILDDTYDKAC